MLKAFHSTEAADGSSRASWVTGSQLKAGGKTLVAKEELMKSEIIGPAEVRPFGCVCCVLSGFMNHLQSLLFHLTS